MKILVINAGSSSLKYQLMDPKSDQPYFAKGLCERIGDKGAKITQTVPGKDKYIYEGEIADHAKAVSLVLKMLQDPEKGVISSLQEIDAVGHRVVHGGEKFADSAIITDEVKKAIRACYPLAPLHNPANMIGIEAMEKALPEVKGVAVFDTAFHQTMPPAAYMYAVPYKFYKEEGIRRYGFHGTSHKYVSQKAVEELGLDPKTAKVITCHLGNGSSVAAVLGEKCVDTSMGLTPLAGLAMGTRCGDIDPAIVTMIMKKEGLSPEEMDHLMNKESGMAGVSGVGSDFRDLEAAADKGDKGAQLALDMFAYQVAKFVGSYYVALGGCDALVFTAGIGENDALIRGKVCAYLKSLGVAIDESINEKTHGKLQKISTDDSKFAVMVIPTNEELAIAQDTARLLG